MVNIVITISIIRIICYFIMISFFWVFSHEEEKKNKENLIRGIARRFFFFLTTPLSSHQILMPILGNEPLKIMACGLRN